MSTTQIVLIIVGTLVFGFASGYAVWGINEKEKKINKKEYKNKQSKLDNCPDGKIRTRTGDCVTVPDEITPEEYKAIL